MTEQIYMPSDWWREFWAAWFIACSGRADEEHALDLAAEHYPANRDRPAAVVAAELYALDPLPPLDGQLAKPYSSEKGTPR